jgi:sodium/proline symporter
LTFYWGRFSGRGAAASLTAGLLTTIVWITTGWEELITARAVTFFIALAAGIVFGKMGSTVGKK